MRRLLFWLLGMALFLGALIVGWRLAAANAAPLDLNLIWVTLDGIAVWQLVLISMAMGGSGVLLGASVLGARGWLLRRRYRGTIRRLESELHQMRSLPLAGATGAFPSSGEPGPSVPGADSPSPSDRQA